MRFSFAGARPEPVDRNPGSNQPLWYGPTTIAPHATTQRFTYNVPSGKKVQVCNVAVSMLRVTAAAPVGLWEAYVTGTNGLVYLQSLKNAIGDSEHGEVGTGIFYQVGGPSVSAYTRDQSTGGTVRYSISAEIVEFDA